MFDKSTYSFCGHKYRPTLRIALTGASLPAAPRFLGCHFSRAKTPQDFSAGGKPDDDKEEDAGILAYAKDDNAVSADFRLGSLQGRKTLREKEDAPQRGGLPEAKRRVSTTGAQVASDAKAWVSLLSEGKKVRNKVNIPRSGDVYLREGKS